MTDTPAPNPPEADGPSSTVGHRIIEQGAAELEGLVAPEHRREVVRRVLHTTRLGVRIDQTEITAHEHSGPIPSPVTVEAYERILPGSADRMIAMAERDQAAYIASNRRQQWLDFSFNVTALVAGLAALMAIISGVVFLADRGHEIAAAALAGLGVSGIVGALVNARLRKPPTDES